MVLQVVASRQVQNESFISLGALRKRLDPETQQLLATQGGFCVSCGGTVRQHGPDYVCVSCGQVWDEAMDFEEGIPFETSSTESGHSESHYSPPSELAFGKAMGSVLDGRAFFRILAKAPSGNKDLPLRACFIRTLSTKIDHPAVTSLLSYGSELCYRFGFKSNSDTNQVFSNQLGRLLRKVAAYYILRNSNEGELRRVANAVFYMQFVQTHPNGAQKVFLDLNLYPELLRYVESLLLFLQCPKKPKKPKAEA